MSVDIPESYLPLTVADGEWTYGLELFPSASATCALSQKLEANQVVRETSRIHRIASCDPGSVKLVKHFFPPQNEHEWCWKEVLKLDLAVGR